MTCEILVTKGDGQEVAARIIFNGGRVTAVPANSEIAKNVLSRSNWVDGGRRRVKLEDDPRAWFLGLPETYSGSRVRARMV